MIHALRYPVAIVFMVLAAHASDIWKLATGRGEARAGGADHGEHVILVVADGLRWQEVFRGADSLLLFHSNALGGNRDAIRRAFWRASLHERRGALMPFLWRTIANQGQLYGNRDAGSVARVTNPMKFSYPGYNEMLVGAPDPRIDRNDYGPNPNVTVFEWLSQREDFRDRVGVAGTWETFRDIFNERRSGLHVDAPGSDAGTHAAALRLLQRKPRALFVGYGETDDFAHKGRYDLTLGAAHSIDGYVADIWRRAQESPAMRGRTTLILVADHGRGRTAGDWTDHGNDIPGSDETWMAIIGPGVTAAGEQRDGPGITLAQTAATVAAVLGLDYVSAFPRAAPALAGAARRSSRGRIASR